jgi:hypothetical protein
MTEKKFIKRVCDKLPAELHSQSMTYASLSTTGTPDRYFDGPQDLWIEFKKLKSNPLNGIVVGDFSDRQKQWLARRYKHGKNAWGIVGLKCGTQGIIMRTPAAIRDGLPIEQALSIKQIAEAITEYCYGRKIVFSDERSKKTSPARRR